MINESISVKCPACQKEFSLSEAVISSVRQEVTEEVRANLDGREKELLKRQNAIETQHSDLKKLALEIESQVEEKTEKLLKERVTEIKAVAVQKALQDQDLVLKELRGELEEKSFALKQAQIKELSLLKERRQLDEARENLQLEVHRKLNEERGKLKEEAKAQSDEENRLKIAEREKLINDLKVRLEDAQRKAEQGSQQSQGEILELDFERKLREAFPTDEIDEVSKGIRGADIFHEVKSKTGRTCGTILYENKRTRNWSDAWIPKLKSDMLNMKADIGVIVTEALPPSSDIFCRKDEIWVTDPQSAIPLCHVLRCLLQEVSIARGHRDGAKEKMELLYSYLTGNEFPQRVSSVIEAFRSMRSDLEAERRAMTKQWSKREKHINSVVENMAGMIGDVQAISGNALKDIPALEFTEISELDS